ncbi:unnamed protein product [Paramecium sonneborni]|uniref:Uncharacterized protein n=1 Tax=Paramecium sonneborni TaxID=65129 RepID=A0A8S1RRK1_9CILI|nr:unnamed protein product [Paramecium sonneborni]
MNRFIETSKVYKKILLSGYVIKQNILKIMMKINWSRFLWNFQFIRKEDIEIGGINKNEMLICIQIKREFVQCLKGKQIQIRKKYENNQNENLQVQIISQI